MSMATQKYVVTLVHHLRSRLISRQALAKDLKDTLFKKDSPECERMEIEIRRGKTLVITGVPSTWRNFIIEWLKAKGF